jgi:hypothetical protein
MTPAKTGASRAAGPCLLALLGALALPACSCGGGGTSATDQDGGTTSDAGPGGSDAAGDNDGGTSDGSVGPTFSLLQVNPGAASRQLDTSIVVLGAAIEPGATLVLRHCDDSSVTIDLSSSVQVASDGESLTALLQQDGSRPQGLYTVVVTNPGQEERILYCALRVTTQPPPTVTQVVGSTAFAGIPGDGKSADTLVHLSGTGFESTPSVRWVKVSDPSVFFDALIVNFVSSTEISAVVPTETLDMPTGDYHVFVINPNQLTGQWMVSGSPGVFQVSDVPPPQILDVTPTRMNNNDCTNPAPPVGVLTVTGSGFDSGATVWWIAPPGTTCTGQITDENGQLLCPMTGTPAQDGTSITGVMFDPATCGLSTRPIVVRNSDGQSDTFFSVSLRTSNDGHLPSGDFDLLTPQLGTARFKHGATYGFDAFGNAFLYVVGGQDASGSVVSSSELSQVDIFGNLGAFATSMQYESPANPRVVNSLATPRQGATLVRVDRDLFFIGGAASASDVAASVPALTSTDRAQILDHRQRPILALPRPIGGTGVPLGSWYYQVSAVGAWGESLPSYELVARNVAGRIELCWGLPPGLPGTTRFNIFRSLAADGRAQSTAAIAYEQSGTCFVDDAAGVLTPAPGYLRGGVQTGGTLAAGIHSYRVSATVTLPDSSSFETYAGYPADIEVTASDVSAGNRTVALSWEPLSGATYTVYKWNGTAYRRLATGLGAATYSDDGATATDPVQGPRTEIRPLPPGSLSRWEDSSVPDLGVAREGLDGVVIDLEPSMTSPVTARILVAGGRSVNDATAYHRTAESLAIHDDGTLGTSWEAETPLFTHARAFYSLLTTQYRDVTPFPPDPEEPPCADLDADGHTACTCGGDDCDDADDTVYPGASEVCGDQIDQDCDQGCGTGTDPACSCSTDADGDGHASRSCGGDDCCDSGSEGGPGCASGTAASIHPAAIEACGNGIDEDCDGVDPTCDCNTDADGDGHKSLACGGDDCCDVGTDASKGCTADRAAGIHPGAVDECQDGIDQDCTGGEPVCFTGATARPAGALRARDPLASRSHRPSAPRPAQRPARREPRRGPLPLYPLLATEPIYAVAVLGDEAYDAYGTLTSNAELDSIEACAVDSDTGRLACSSTWPVQVGSNGQPVGTPQASFGIDALLYFDFLYPITGLSKEKAAAGSPPPATSRTLLNGAVSRFPVSVPPINDDPARVLDGYQSGNVKTALPRSHYQVVRLMAYIYVIAGWVDEDGIAPSGPGPTSTIERHLQ